MHIQGNINKFNVICNTLHKIRFTYYSLKCKSKLRNFYYNKIVEPRIRIKGHPEHLIILLEENKGISLEEIINSFEDSII